MCNEVVQQSTEALRNMCVSESVGLLCAARASSAALRRHLPMRQIGGGCRLVPRVGDTLRQGGGGLLGGLKG